MRSSLIRIFTLVMTVMWGSDVIAAPGGRSQSPSSSQSGEPTAPDMSTVSGVVTAIDRSLLTITVDERQYQMIVDVPVVDQSNTPRMLNEVMLGAVVTLTLDPAGQVKKIAGNFPPPRQ